MRRSTALPRHLRSHSLSPRFNTFQTNLLTIPSTVAGMVSMFVITLISEVVNDRALVAMAEDLWTLPFLVAIYLLPENPNQWIYYVSVYMDQGKRNCNIRCCTGSCFRTPLIPVSHTLRASRYRKAELYDFRYTHPIQVGWCSRNSGAVASRTVNASLYNMFVQASSVISSQIYRADDAPRCKPYCPPV